MGFSLVVEVTVHAETGTILYALLCRPQVDIQFRRYRRKAGKAYESIHEAIAVRTERPKVA
jgi:hypothetical protein